MEDGLVTAVAPGFAVVTATVGSVSASVLVTAGSPPTLVLPADLAAIEPGAFQNTAALEAVVIPEGCASIGARAFAGCPALRLVTLPGDIAIDETAFADCASVAFRCPLGSAAAAYAEAHGFAVVPAEK